MDDEHVYSSTILNFLHLCNDYVVDRFEIAPQRLGLSALQFSDSCWCTLGISIYLHDDGMQYVFAYTTVLYKHYGE